MLYTEFPGRLTLRYDDICHYVYGRRSDRYDFCG